MYSKEITLGLLGPDGTFTAQAGLEYCRRKRLDPTIEWYKRIEDCFDGVKKDEVERAVVPLLNSTREASWINATLKGLRDVEVNVYNEQIIPVQHNLVALSGTRLDRIKYVHSKDKAIQQCKTTLSELCLNAEFRYENSTAAAGELISQRSPWWNPVARWKDKRRAAVVPLRAAELYGLEILERDIQDDPRNKTRFFIISKERHGQTADDKTTAIFEFDYPDRPGLIYNVLGEFAKRKISLKFIESIPKEGSLDDFTFYIDIWGHRDEESVKEALEAIERNIDLSYWRVLGSYPIET